MCIRDSPSGGSWNQAECDGVTILTYSCVRAYTDMENLVQLRNSKSGEMRGGIFNGQYGSMKLHWWYLDISYEDFDANTRPFDGGVIYLDGGAGSELNLYYSKIHSSFARDGGAIQIDQGSSPSNGIYGSKINIFNSVFKNNYAYFGGVLYVRKGEVNIEDSIFEGNGYANIAKGGVGYFRDTLVNVRNSKFISNGRQGSNGNCRGGVFSFYYSTYPEILNIEYSTFTTNDAMNGDDIHIDSDAKVYTSLKNVEITAADDIDLEVDRSYTCEDNICGDQTCTAVDTNHPKLGVKCTYPAGTYDSNTYVWNPNTVNTWNSSKVNTWDPRSVNAWDNSSVNTWYDTNPKIWSPIEWIVHEPDTEVRTCKPSSLRDVTKVFSATHNDGNGPTGSITFVALKSDKTIVNWGYNENGGCKNDGTGCSDGSDKNKAVCLANSGCSDTSITDETACLAPVGCNDTSITDETACLDAVSYTHLTLPTKA